MSEPPGATVALAEPPITDGPSKPLTAQRVLPLRRPGRWIVTVVVLVLVAQFVHGLVTNPFYQWDRWSYWFLRPTILDGLLITLQVTAYSAVLGLVGGIVLALGRLSKSPVLRAVSWTYVWAVRSVPLIVVLIFLYNFSALYKTVSVGIPFGPAFFSFDESTTRHRHGRRRRRPQPQRGRLRGRGRPRRHPSVDQGQHEAAAALGLPKSYQFRRIVFPQALRSIIPNYVNQLIGLIKGTSLVFYVSLLDLFGSAQTLGSTYPGDIVPLLLVVTVWYLILTSIVSVVQFYVERHYARGATRSLPPTPLQKFRIGLSDLRARICREAAV